MKNKYINCFLLTAILMTIACTPTSPISREKMLNSDKKTKLISAEWDRGNAMSTNGANMIKEGEKLIERGEATIKDGNQKIASGNKIMRNCEMSLMENIIEADIHEMDEC